MAANALYDCISVRSPFRVAVAVALSPTCADVVQCRNGFNGTDFRRSIPLGQRVRSALVAEASQLRRRLVLLSWLDRWCTFMLCAAGRHGHHSKSSGESRSM